MSTEYERKRSKDPTRRAYRRELARRLLRDPAYRAKKYAKDKERRQTPKYKEARRLYLKRPEVHEKYMRWDRERNRRPERKAQARLRKMQKLYGLTAAQFEALLGAQNHVCPLCGVGLSLLTCHVDHDHLTKKVRGLLCHTCNCGIGFLRDSARIAAAAVRYLENPPAKDLQWLHEEAQRVLA